jgi:beta-lactamase regulating signal transducer with metallopeptidase domain
MNLDQTLVSILGTYALHSTLAIAGAWLVTGPLRLLTEPKAVRGTWKLALFLPLISSAFQLSVGYVPPAFYAFATESSVAQAPLLEAAPVVESVSPAFVAPAWTVVVAALWALGVTLGAWRLAKGELALRRMLSGREEVLEDHAVDTLIELRQRAGVKRRIRLSVSDGLSTPVAVGRSEIVLSRHALDQLPAAQMAGVIGHELAHLEAHDPWWARAIAMVEAAFFFQPLNFLAKRRHRDAAELAADDWARVYGVQGEELARALAEIAATSPEATMPTWAQAAKGGALVRRVERLLAEPSASISNLDAADRVRAQGMPKVAAALGALAAMALLAPRVGFASEPAAPKSAEVHPAASYAFAGHRGPRHHRATSVIIGHHGAHGRSLAITGPEEHVVIVDDGRVMQFDMHDGEDQVHLEIAGDLAEAAREAGEEVRRELERELGHDFAAQIQREVFEELEREGIVIEVNGTQVDLSKELHQAQREIQREARRARRRAERAASEARREAERARARAERAREQVHRARERAERAAEREQRAQERLERERERQTEPAHSAEKVVQPAGQRQPVVAL